MMCCVFVHREGVNEGIEWLTQRVQQNISRQSKQKDTAS